MPFFSPLWARRPHVVWLHHVHDTMWEMTLPPRLARAGRTVEYRVAPPIYRRTQIVTLSESSKLELVQKLHFKAKRIHVVPPGIDDRFSPAAPGTEPRSSTPLVVAVGRLVPVKRFGLLIDALCDIKARHPRLQAIIIGDGYEREMLEAQVRDRDATSWISLPGRVDDAALVDAYRRAWVVASTSAHEGWGMTITEAAACGTPSVATRIAGHEDAVVDGVSGLLADDGAGIAAALDRVLGDDALRARLTAGATHHAAAFTWGATACGTLEVVAAETIRRRGPA
jgi:glycosyltransferase involved in cell wall biosynthesis